MARWSAALALLLLAPAARAGERSAAFTVAVRVVRPFHVRTTSTATATPASTATSASSARARSISAPTAISLVTVRDGARIVTVFPDGAPAALIER